MEFIPLSLGLSLGSLVSREYFMALVVRMSSRLLFYLAIFFSFFFYILVHDLRDAQWNRNRPKTNVNYVRI